MDGSTLTLTLRLIHILAGIFWVGTAILIAWFLVPTMRATSREGGAFMQHLMQRRGLQVFLLLAMVLTVLSGLAMYARLAAATHGSWASTAPGIAYGVGAVAAILGGATGALISGSAGRRLGAIGENIGPSGPSIEQQTEMVRLQGRIGLGTRASAVLLVIAAAAMAVARYL
jgi:hypothetical protein